MHQFTQSKDLAALLEPLRHNTPLGPHFGIIIMLSTRHCFTINLLVVFATTSALYLVRVFIFARRTVFLAVRHFGARVASASEGISLYFVPEFPCMQA